MLERIDLPKETRLPSAYVTTVVEAIDENTILKREVIETVIDLSPLKDELARLTAELADDQEPDTETLIAFGRAFHPHYTERERMQQRVTELEALLNG